MNSPNDSWLQDVKEAGDVVKSNPVASHQSKERRQELKLQCLELSVGACCKVGGDMSNCIEQAKAFYAFVRT